MNLVTKVINAVKVMVYGDKEFNINSGRLGIHSGVDIENVRKARSANADNLSSRDIRVAGISSFIDSRGVIHYMDATGNNLGTMVTNSLAMKAGAS